jgi:flagellar hook-associated protein 1 FlgK
MAKTSLLQTLNATRGALDVYSDNISKAKTPGARAIDPTMNQSYIGTSLRTSLGQTRRDDPLVTKIQVAQLTKSSELETVSNFLRVVQSEIGSGKDPQKSNLVTSVTDFLSQSTILPGNGGISMKQAFIDRGQDLAININKVTNRINDLRYNADRDLGAAIDHVNSAIRNLFEINQAITKSGVGGAKAFELFDTRDDLVRTIAETFEISVNYGSRGEALITSAGNSLPVVSAASYSKLSYEGFSSQEAILAGEDPKPVNLTLLDSDNKGNVFEAIGSKGLNAGSMGGGKIGALINLRDQKLKDSYNAVQQLVKAVTDSVNRVHNDGSTWPPKTKFQSDINVSGTDTLAWGGKVSMYPVNANGDQLQGGAGPLNAITIDFDKLPNSLGGVGSPSVWDVLRELNSQLDIAPSRTRVAMGAILADDPNVNSGVAQVQGQYLLNNVQLAGMSKIDNAGNFTLDLDLMGNQYFGSTVEVLEVTTSGGYNVPVSQLPQAFRLDKDTNSRTGGAITVGGIAGPAQTINVKIRVTGDNGVVSQGIAGFTVDPANPDLFNKRIAANPIGVPVPGVINDFTNQAISHSGVATARLVDDNGVEILEGDGRAGKIVIETNSPDYRLVIQDGNFSSLLKLNDLIKHDETTGLIKIRDDITDNVNLLSTGKITRSDGKKVGATVGDALATANLTFSGGGNFALNDTVTIHDQPFTFVTGAPANQNEVQITGGGLAGDVLALLTAIQNHSELKSIVTASSPVPANNTINLIAKTAGTSGNILVADANLDPLGVVNVSLQSGANAPTAPAPAVNGFLSGGTVKPVEVQQIYSYNIGSKSAEVLNAFNALRNKIMDFAGSGIVPDSNMTLGSYASQITSVLSNQANDADSDSTVANGVLSKIQDRINNEFGIKSEEQYQKFLDLAQYLRDIAAAMKELNSTMRSVHDILFN